jgi:hypothetical protein
MWEEVNTADHHYHDDDKYKSPLSLILKWLYTALNTKMDTNSEPKKGKRFWFCERQAKEACLDCPAH